MKTIFQLFVVILASLGTFSMCQILPEELNTIQQLMDLNISAVECTDASQIKDQLNNAIEKINLINIEDYESLKGKIPQLLPIIQELKTNKENQIKIDEDQMLEKMNEQSQQQQKQIDKEQFNNQYELNQDQLKQLEAKLDTIYVEKSAKMKENFENMMKPKDEWLDQNGIPFDIINNKDSQITQDLNEDLEESLKKEYGEATDFIIDEGIDGNQQLQDSYNTQLQADQQVQQQQQLQEQNDNYQQQTYQDETQQQQTQTENNNYQQETYQDQTQQQQVQQDQTYQDQVQEDLTYQDQAQQQTQGGNGNYQQETQQDQTQQQQTQGENDNYQQQQDTINQNSFLLKFQNWINNEQNQLVSQKNSKKHSKPQQIRNSNRFSEAFDKWVLKQNHQNESRKPQCFIQFFLKFILVNNLSNLPIKQQFSKLVQAFIQLRNRSRSKNEQNSSELLTELTLLDQKLQELQIEINQMFEVYNNKNKLDEQLAAINDKITQC